VNEFQELRKKLSPIQILLLLIFILILLFFILGGGSSEKVKNEPNENKPELEASIEINQSSYSVSISASDKDGDSSTPIESLFYTVSPNISISTTIPDSIEAIKIENFRVTEQPEIQHSVVRAYPDHQLGASEYCLGFFFEGCDNSFIVNNAPDLGDSYTYSLTDSYGGGEFYGELYPGAFIPQLKIAFTDIADINKDKILEESASYDGSRVLEYSGVGASDLASTVAFDLVIDTTEGKWTKTFVMDITEDELAGVGASNVPIDEIL
jgi:hypothetical protein